MRSVVSVVVARGGAEGLFLLRGLLLARLLGAAAFGLWSAMRLVLLFGQYLQLGAREGMLQRVPWLRGRGDAAAARAAAATATALNLLAAAASPLVVLAVVRGGNVDARPWLLFALVLGLAQLFWLAQAWQQATGRFGELATTTFGFAALSTLLGLAAALWRGLDGFVAALGLSYAVSAAWGALRRPRLPRPRIAAGPVRELLAQGAPILAGEALQVLLWNHDKVLVGWLAGRQALGLYSVPATLTAALMLAPLALQHVLYPRLLEDLGRREPDAAVGVLRAARAVAWVSPLLLVPLIALLGPALRLLLPGYEAAVEPGRALVAASYLPIVAAVPSAVLVALGRQRTLVGIRLAAVAVGAVGVAWTLVQGGDLVSVAAATALGFAVYSAACCVATTRAAGLTHAAAARTLAQLFAPGLVVGAALLLPRW